MHGFAPLSADPAFQRDDARRIAQREARWQQALLG
jgi:hypothetical protein